MQKLELGPLLLDDDVNHQSYNLLRYAQTEQFGGNVRLCILVMRFNHKTLR